MPETLTALIWVGAVVSLSVAATLVGVVYTNMDKRVETLTHNDAKKHDRISALETEIPVLKTRVAVLETKIMEKLDTIIATQAHEYDREK